MSKKNHSPRKATAFCTWFGQALLGLFKSVEQNRAKSTVVLGAAVGLLSLPRVSAEENEEVVVSRLVSGQVAKVGEEYSTVLRPENYITSTNSLQRFDVLGQEGNDLPAWMTLTKTAEVEALYQRQVDDTFENADSENGLLFVAAGKAGIKVYNITNVDRPHLQSIISTPGYARGLDVQLPYLYVAADTQGFQVWNLSDSLFPKTFVSQVKGVWQARDVKVRNNIAYVAAETSGIRLIDLTDLSTPKELKPYTNSATSKNLCWLGDHLLSAEGIRGLGVYSISSEGSITLVKQRMDSFVWGQIDWVTVDGDKIHLFSKYPY